jgi:serine/threonine protein kinase
MASFQVSLNLKDVCRFVRNVVKDVRNLEDDSDTLAAEFRHVLGRSESLGRIVMDKKYNNKSSLLEVVGDLQREAMLECLGKVAHYWQKFGELVEAHKTPTTADPSQPVLKSVGGKIKKRYTWAFGGKAEAEKILCKVKRLNANLGDDIDLAVKHFVDTSSTATVDLVRDRDAQAVGLSSSVALRNIERDITPPNRKLLFPPETVELTSGNVEQDREVISHGLFRNRSYVIVEYRYYTEYKEDTLDRALKLATFLNNPISEQIAVLPCIGLCHAPAKKRFEYIFDISELTTSDVSTADVGQEAAFPKLYSLSSQFQRNDEGIFRYSKFGYQPSYTSSPTRPLSLCQRLSFARSIALTVQQLHLLDWLHQNIRSDSIWFTINSKLDPDGNIPELGRPYLFSFQFARMVNTYSDPHRKDPLPSLRRNLYRHPERYQVQGNMPEVPHKKIHDIYSLGIVLLEIGIGQTALKVYGVLPVLLGLEISTEQVLSDVDGRTPPSLSSGQIKDGFVRFAARYLPEKMGDRYTSVVVACLTGQFSLLITIDDDSELSLQRAFKRGVVDTLYDLSQSV